MKRVTNRGYWRKGPPAEYGSGVLAICLLAICLSVNAAESVSVPAAWLAGTPQSDFGAAVEIDDTGAPPAFASPSVDRRLSWIPNLVGKATAPNVSGALPALPPPASFNQATLSRRFFPLPSTSALIPLGVSGAAQMPSAPGTRKPFPATLPFPLPAELASAAGFDKFRSGVVPQPCAIWPGAMSLGNHLSRYFPPGKAAPADSVLALKLCRAALSMNIPPAPRERMTALAWDYFRLDDDRESGQRGMAAFSAWLTGDAEGSARLPVEQRFSLGEMALRAGDARGAWEMFRPLYGGTLPRGPREMLPFLLGSAAFRMGHPDEGCAWLRTGLAKYPDNSMRHEAKFLLAWRDLTDGREEAAWASFNDLLDDGDFPAEWRRRIRQVRARFDREPDRGRSEPPSHILPRNEPIPHEVEVF